GGGGGGGRGKAGRGGGGGGGGARWGGPSRRSPPRRRPRRARPPLDSRRRSSFRPQVEHAGRFDVQGVAAVGVLQAPAPAQDTEVRALLRTPHFENVDAHRERLVRPNRGGPLQVRDAR